MTKEKLSIDLFGKTKFYTGLFIGLGTAIVLNLFFAYFREILRNQTFSRDLLIPTTEEFIVYNLFFAAVSITAGLGLTIWFWFHNPFSLKISKYWVLFIRTYSIFWTISLLLVVSRVGSVLTWVLYTIHGYDDHLNFYKEFPIILILLPTIAFLNIWTPVRLKYRTGKWFWISIVIYCLLTALLGFNSPIDQNKLNVLWHSYNEPYTRIVDNEINRAKLNGIHIADRAIDPLRVNMKQRVHDQAKDLKDRFESRIPVPIDTVVIELIHAKKTTIRYLNTGDWSDTQALWPFANPRNVYQQIELTQDSLKIMYLKELIKEFNDIFSQEDPWKMDLNDGLDDKYYNRLFMQRRYRDIKKELDDLQREN